MNNGLNNFPMGWMRQDPPFLMTIDESRAILKQEWKRADTYNNISPPAGAGGCVILAYSGGGGGQGGACQVAGTVAAGGGGGGGGGADLVAFRLSAFPSWLGPLNFQVIVGAGGAGGAGRNTVGGGNAGSTGGNTTVSLTNSARTVLTRLAYAEGAAGGSGTSGQRNGTGGKVAAWAVQFRSQAGGGTPGWNSGGFRFPSSWITNNTGVPHPYNCGGGGSGGVVNTDGTSKQAGGAGGYGFYYFDGIYRAADGGTGAGADAREDEIIFGGVGGNGGYSAGTAEGDAFVGGAGIRGGGGGGGGGKVTASAGTTSSGAGGKGGDGYAMILWVP